MLHIGICDDEPDELGKLRLLVAEYGAREGVSLDLHCFGSGEELIAAMTRGRSFDLLFLDIFMGSMDGIAVAGKVREFDKACRIILATNSRAHAIDGYGVRALRYLLKPIAAEELASAMDQALEDLREKDAKYVQVKNRQGMYRIPIDDIVFAESRAKIVTIHTHAAGDVSFSDRLDGFSLQCDDRRFLRCHKSFLVNLDYVYAIVDNNFVMKSGEEIRISMSIAQAKAIFAEHSSRHLKMRENGDRGD